MPDIFGPPQGGWGAPRVDFSWLANLPNNFYQGAQEKQQYDRSRAFQNGLPMDANGNVDWTAVAQTLAKNGDVQNLPALANQAQNQKFLTQAQGFQPIAPGTAPQASPVPSQQPVASPPAQPIPQSSLPPDLPPASAAASSPAGQTNGASVDQIAASVLPKGSPQASAVAANVAKALRVSPDAPLTQDQQERAKRILASYTKRNGMEMPGSGLLSTGMRDYIARERAIESGGNPNAVSSAGAQGPDQFMPATARQYGLTNPRDPVASADATARLTADNASELTKRLGRPPTEAELYLAHQQGAAGAARLLSNPDVPAGKLVSPAAIRQNGGDPKAPASQFVALWQDRFNGQGPGRGPIGPQVPLPQGFQDPQQAILALRAQAAKLSVNPYARGQADFYNNWAARIESSTKPTELRAGETLLDPRTGQVLYQAPGANPAAAGQLINLENAERAQRGLPPMTAQEEIAFIQGVHPPRSAPAMAVEQFKSDFQRQNGRQPTAEEITKFASNYSREQSYGRAAGTQGARVENAANEVVQLIPQAIEASRTVPRGRWVPINQLVQKWDQGTSDPAYNDFMMANFSLLNAYTRAMNPQGVPRIQERLEQHALGVLSTATDEKSYEVQIRRLWKEVQASKTATAETAKGVTPGNINAPVPGLDSPTGSSGAPKHISTKAEYDALPSGTDYIAPDGNVRTKH